MDVFDAVGIDAVIGSEHALVPLDEVELAEVGLGPIRVVYFRLCIDDNVKSNKTVALS